jgi:replicative DNA helicase
VSEGVVELPGAGRQAPEFERTPPQDVGAEQSVLGGMLLSKDAIADVVEVVRGNDFYKPAHQTVFDVVVDLYGRGEPADAVTVSAELTRRGEIGRIGGAPYLHTLLASVPTAANAGFYARIVAEQAVLRRLVEAGTRIVQLGYGTGGAGDVDDIVDRAQQAVYDVTERRASEDYVQLTDLMNPTMDELEAISGRGGGMSGVPTGFADLDRLTNGLHPGQLIVIAGRPGLGKALALDTPLPTPTGWTTMGEVAVGDALLGADGRPITVVAATPVMTGRPCYRVSFSDGASIVADAEHQWVTTDRAARRSSVGAPAVRTTVELATTLRCRTADRRLNHAVSTAAALRLPDAALPAPPYAVGAALGGDVSAPEIAMRLEALGARCAARVAGAVDGGRVPAAYLRAGERQRRDLLSGLMDAGGTAHATGSCQFATASEGLADDVEELVVSLGMRCARSARRAADGRALLTTLTFTTDEQVFLVEDKNLLHKERLRAHAPARTRLRYVTAVEPVESVPVRCVQVDAADSLYLAGRAMVPTHNSTLGLDVARTASIKHGHTSAIFSLEMSKTEITMRLLSAEARVPLHHMRSGTMTDDDWTRLATRMGQVSEAPLFIDDSPNLTMMEIRAKARRLKQRQRLSLLVIDYLQLMSGNKKAESRQQEVSELSRSLKLLAKELEIPVIAMSQLNRGAEQRTDKRPQLSDLRESGCLPASSRVLRADTGAEVSLGELYRSGARDVPVWSLDPSLRYVRRHLTHVFSTGTKPVHRLRLASGKTLRATANHPLLTAEGWLPLGALEAGMQVAVPRHVPAPETERPWRDEDVVHHAAFVGVARTQSRDRATAVAQLPKRQLRLFLSTLWAAAGTTGADGAPPRLAVERSLADEISRLLLRFGISVQRVEGTGRDLGRVELRVEDRDDRARFAKEIAATAPAEARLRDVAVHPQRSPRGAKPSSRVWSRVRSVLDRQPATVGGPALPAVAAELDAGGLDLVATNDVLWDAVVSVEPDGVEEVFDATVVGTHNFIADGVAVHNSIEQDADMVILLHREDAYEKESPRAGEADFIVAKHRNGPTDTITVAFQGHYSRFVDMSPG